MTTRLTRSRALTSIVFALLLGALIGADVFPPHEAAAWYRPIEPNETAWASVLPQSDAPTLTGTIADQSLTQGVEYTSAAALPAATGATGTVIYSVASLPTGLRLNSDRKITGTATSPLAITSFTYTATDTIGPATLTFTLSVKPRKPVLQGGPMDTRAVLVWDKNKGVTKWQYKQDAGSWTDITGSSQGTGGYIAGSLTNGTAYNFKVRALVGDSGASPSTQVTGLESDAVSITPKSVDYDADNDTLIDIATIAQLHAMRWNRYGAGTPERESAHYYLAFPGAAPGMGCPDTDADGDLTNNCDGFELLNDLDFDTNGDGKAHEPKFSIGDVCSESGGVWSGADCEYDDWWNGGRGWSPIGSVSRHFLATLNGNGFSIFNMYVNQTGDSGLFGLLGPDAAVKNLGIRDARIRAVQTTSTGRWAGAIAGRNYGEISLSWAHGGSVEAVRVGVTNKNSSAGGIAGFNGLGGAIQSSWSAVVVSAVDAAGGLVGHNAGEISNSYATGAVKNAFRSGGLAGLNRHNGSTGTEAGSITNSYAIGSTAAGSLSGSQSGGLVGKEDNTSGSPLVTESYWDTTTTGQSSSAGGVGKTTDQLQDPTTPPTTANCAGVETYCDWLVTKWDFLNADHYPVITGNTDGDDDSGWEEVGPQYLFVLDTTGPIADQSLTQGVEYTSATALPAAINGTGTVTYSVADLPTGLSLNSDRKITGTATRPLVVTSYTYTATDDEGTPSDATDDETDSLTFNLSVKPRKPNLEGGPMDTRAVLVWDKNRGVTKWQYKQDAGSWTDIANSSQGTGGYIVGSLTNGTAYSFKVRSLVGSGATQVIGLESDAVSITPKSVDYDADDDTLIEISTIAQLNAMRWNRHGAGTPERESAQYYLAFPGAAPGMGCPDDNDGNLRNDCDGFELLNDLDFDTNGDGKAHEPKFSSGDVCSQSGGVWSGADCEYDDWWNGGRGWSPIGSVSRHFLTTLNGNGFSIFNMYINQTGDSGLFGLLGPEAVVKNLGIRDARILATQTTSTGRWAGAIAGRNYGEISFSWAHGGSVEVVRDGVTNNNSSAGGLAGFNGLGGAIQSSWSAMDVKAIFAAGGLVGHNAGAISNSYATGAVKNAYRMGGLVGFNRHNTVGTEEGEITNSYAVGSTATSSVAGSNSGGLVGRREKPSNVSSLVSESYWDTTTTGQASSAGGAGRTTQQLQDPTAPPSSANCADGNYTGDKTYCDWSAGLWDFVDGDNYPVIEGDTDADGDSAWEEVGPQILSFDLSATSATVAENGGSSTYTVALTFVPRASVTVTASSADADKLTLNKSGGTAGASQELTFTTGNWDTAQTITFTAVNNNVDAVNASVKITHAASSADSNYDIAASTTEDIVTVTITDDDTAGFDLSATIATVGENGGTATYNVALDTEPTADVTVTVASDDSTKLKVNKSGVTAAATASLTFTADNWDTDQAITLTGVDNDIDAADASVIVKHAASSTDSNYDITASGTTNIVTVAITDDDTAGIDLSATSATVGENGGESTYDVELASEPTASVTLTVASADSDNLTVNKSGGTAGATQTLTFTDANWDTAQTITFKAVDNDLDAANDSVKITHAAASTDSKYTIEASTSTNIVTVAITNDDTAGFTLSPTSATVDEDGGASSYTIALATVPTADVTVTVTVPTADSSKLKVNKSGGTEGATQSLTFTDANWATAQTITFTAEDNDIDAANAIVKITHGATSTDTNYTITASATVNVFTVTISDDDAKGFTLSKTSATVAEAGGESTYTVELSSEPTASVTVTVTSATPALLTVNKASGTAAGSQTLTFTTANWDTAQTITFKAINNAVDADNIVNITHKAASTDSNYTIAASPTNDIVAVTITDDDAKGFTLSAPVNATVGENGGSSTYTVKLKSEPTASVTVTVTSADSDKLTVNKSGGTEAASQELTFTTTTWSTAQTITFKAVDNDIDAANASVKIKHSSSSEDDNYDITASDSVNIVTISITDDDAAGFTLSPTSDTVDEAGGSDTYDVELKSEPTASVTVTVTSPDSTNLKVNKTGVAAAATATLTFTTDNWDTAQTITFKSFANDIDADNIVKITHSASSDDSKYDIAASSTVNIFSVTITDDDAKGFTLSSPVKATVGEDGGSSTYTVKLASEPTATVTVTVTSDDSDKLTVNKTGGTAAVSQTLTFTTTTWSTAQTITFKAVDNDIDAANASVKIKHGSSSDDSNYTIAASTTLNIVTITITDDDAKGFTLSAPVNATIAEADGSSTYTVKLKSEPTDEVTVTVASATPAQLTVNKDSGTAAGLQTLTFTTDNWDTAQTITFKAVSNHIDADNVVNIKHSSSSDDGNYAITASDSVNIVTITITDDDAKGIKLSKTSATVGENGGMASYTVVLESQPTHQVTVTATSADSTKLKVNKASVAAAETATLTFTTGNWDTAQTVTLTGVDNFDDAANPSVKITHAAASTDANYTITASQTEDIVTVAITDDDTAGFTLSKTSATVVENAGSDTYTIALATKPTEDVTVTVTSADSDKLTVKKSGGTAAGSQTLDFTAANWNTAQTITFKAVKNDIDADNSVKIKHTSSSDDTKYTITSSTKIVTVTITDDDTAGFTLSSPVNATIAEAGGSSTYTVALASEPTATVTVTVTSDDSDKLTVNKSGGTAGVSQTLAFTTATWKTPQTITFAALDNHIDAANASVKIKHGSSSDDANYAITASTTLNIVTVTITDDDTAGFTLSAPVSATVGENGGSSTYTVKLASKPTASVTVTVTSADSTKLKVNKDSVAAAATATLTFTAGNWDTAQTITFTAEDNDLDAANASVKIKHGSSSDDANYDITASDSVNIVTISITDDDTAGLTLSKSIATIAEDGGSSTYTVVLDTKPTESVTVTATSATPANLKVNKAGAAAAATATLTFTTDNWSTAQTITFTAENNAVAGGNASVKIKHEASSDDSNYDIDASETVDIVTVTITDDDSAGISLSKTSAKIDEDADSDTYDVELNTQPTATVTLTVTSADVAKLTVNKSSGTAGASQTLTFTTGNWSAPQPITFAALSNDIDAADASVKIKHGAASDDDSYAIDASTTLNIVTVTITDDDTAGFTLSKTSATVVEDGGSDTYTIALASKPTENVTVTATSATPAQLTVNKSGGTAGGSQTLAFTAANWSTAQTITFKAVDNDVDADNSVKIKHTSSSTDSKYTITSSTKLVTVAITDDDTAGISLSKTSATIAENGGSSTYDVELDTEPTDEVTLTVTSADSDNLTVNKKLGTAGASQELTFTADNWDTAQTITLKAVDNDVDAANASVKIQHSADGGDDDNYDIAASETENIVTVAIADDDTAGFTLSKTSATIDEDGGSSTYTIALATKPTADVTVTVTSDDVAKLTVEKTGAAAGASQTLTFTAALWNTPQTITFTAVDNAIDAANASVKITHAAASTDTNYDIASSTTNNIVTVTITDDDSPGISLSETSATIAENGGSDTYTVALNTQPTASVTLTVTSADSTKLRVNKTAGTAGASQTLTFTTGNWNTAQTITLTAIDNDIDAADASVKIKHSASSDDSDYDIAVSDSANIVTVTITDDDVVVQAGIVLSKTAATIAENGGSDTYTVALNTQPTASVTLTVTSADATKLTVNKSGGTVGASQTLTFTTGNWSAPQTITLAAIDNDVDAADAIVKIKHSSTSADTDYNIAASETANIVTVTITDDDVVVQAGIVLSKTSATIAENGGSTTYTVALASAPTASVAVTAASANAAKLTVNKSGGTAGASQTLTFTTGNWNTAQTITLAAVDNAIDAADASVKIKHSSSSADTDYDIAASETANIVTVTITDDDVDVSPPPPPVIIVVVDDAGIVLSSSSVTISEGGSGSYTARLDSEPTRDVEVTATVPTGVASALQLYKSGGGAAASTQTLTFTPANWSSTQIITLLAPDNDVDGSDTFVTIQHSSSSVDTNYNIAASNESHTVRVTITDDDVAGVSTSGTRFTVSENGGSDRYTVTLDSAPTGDVSVTATVPSGDVGALTLAGGATQTLTFTTENWNVAQSIAFTAIDNNVPSTNSVNIGHAVSSVDPKYANISVASVRVTITDDDVSPDTPLSAGIVLSKTSSTISEDGGSSSYTVALASQPSAPVTVTARVSDSSALTLGGASSRSFTFTPDNWSSAQLARFTAVNNNRVDGGSMVRILHGATSSDPAYRIPFSDSANIVTVTITDDDSGGLSFARTTIAVDENGGSSAYAVKLASRPAAPALVTATSIDASKLTLNVDEGTAGASQTLTFTTSNWFVYQPVEATAIDNSVVEPSTVVITHSAASDDDDYDIAASTDRNIVTVTIEDDDSAGFALSPDVVAFPENGGGDTYNVELTSQPTASALVTVTSGDPSRLTVGAFGAAMGASQTLVFTGEDWNEPQIVTLASIDNDVDAEDASVAITHTATSDDPNYVIEASETANVVIAMILDDDDAGVTLSKSAATIAENGGADAYDLRLNSQPTRDVQVTVRSDDSTKLVVGANRFSQAGILNLTFTPENWSDAQTVFFAAVDNDVDADNARVSIKHAAASSDRNYAVAALPAVAVTIDDDDTAGIALSVTETTIDEGASGAYSLRLDSQPSQDVRVFVVADDDARLDISPSTLTFTSVNWNRAQLVFIVATDNEDDEADAIVVRVTHSAASRDASYTAAALGSDYPLTVTIVDDDLPPTPTPTPRPTSTPAPTPTPTPEPTSTPMPAPIVAATTPEPTSTPPPTPTAIPIERPEFDDGEGEGERAWNPLGSVVSSARERLTLVIFVGLVALLALAIYLYLLLRRR